jgi:spore germination cell wall hydrolase CwlJ-like protein
MSVASLTGAVTPSILKARPYRYSSRDKECMARVMYFESNRSSRDGMVAVGTVVMNRLRSGKHGGSICEVVGEAGQFAPGALTRKMDSRGADLARDTAEAVLKGERSPKLKNAMFFHTAGLKFPYKNMHYVLVAGGNSFYEKRTRNWQPLPPETMVAYSGSTPDVAPPVMVASAEPAPVQPAARSETVAPQPQVVVASASPAPEAQAFASVEPPRPTMRPDEGRVAAASVKPAVKSARKRMPQAETVPFALASADEPVPRSERKIAVPSAAPVPTARAAMIPLPSRKVAKKEVAPQPVQVAAEEPIAARFGDDDPSMSMGFAQ